MNDLQIPSDLQQMFEDSKLDTTTFVGSDIRTLIVRVAEAESWASRLSAELDKGDSWAWIRSKMEKCRTQFKWYTPRTDSLIGTRYEVMGWLHVLFAHADPKVYIDITMEQQKKADDAEAENKKLRECIRELLKGGEHEGFCTNSFEGGAEFETGACAMHCDASDAREAAARKLLEELDAV